jgi:hypothetical protein
MTFFLCDFARTIIHFNEAAAVRLDRTSGMLELVYNFRSLTYSITLSSRYFIICPGVRVF